MVLRFGQWQKFFHKISTIQMAMVCGYIKHICIHVLCGRRTNVIQYWLKKHYTKCLRFVLRFCESVRLYRRTFLSPTKWAILYRIHTVLTIETLTKQSIKSISFSKARSCCGKWVFLLWLFVRSPFLFRKLKITQMNRFRNMMSINVQISVTLDIFLST